jgi:hypothetical protein
MLAGFVPKRGRGRNTPQSLKRLGDEGSPRLDPYLKLHLEDWSLAVMTSLGKKPDPTMKPLFQN